MTVCCYVRSGRITLRGKLEWILKEFLVVSLQLLLAIR
jgi:hypothetical protein